MYTELKLRYRLARMQAKALIVFAEDQKAESPIALIIGIFLIAVLAGALLPSGINSLVAGRNATWAAGTLGAYDAISILLVVAVIAAVAGIAMHAL